MSSRRTSIEKAPRGPLSSVSRQTVASLVDALCCPICLEVAQLPVSLICFQGCPGTHGQANGTCCRASLCQHCANDALQLERPPDGRFADSGGKARCLICRETKANAGGLSPLNAYLVNHPLMDVMDGLGLGATCCKCNLGFTTQAALQDHYLRRCPSAIVQCKFELCRHFDVRAAVAAHEETCPRGRSRCLQCSDYVDKEDLFGHMLHQCRRRVVECHLCSHKAALPDMLAHLKDHQAQLQRQALPLPLGIPLQMQMQTQGGEGGGRGRATSSSGQGVSVSSNISSQPLLAGGGSQLQQRERSSAPVRLTAAALAAMAAGPGTAFGGAEPAAAVQMSRMPDAAPVADGLSQSLARIRRQGLHSEAGIAAAATAAAPHPISSVAAFFQNRSMQARSAADAPPAPIPSAAAGVLQGGRSSGFSADGWRQLRAPHPASLAPLADGGGSSSGASPFSQLGAPDAFNTGGGGGFPRATDGPVVDVDGGPMAPASSRHHRDHEPGGAARLGGFDRSSNGSGGSSSGGGGNQTASTTAGRPPTSSPPVDGTARVSTTTGQASGLPTPAPTNPPLPSTQIDLQQLLALVRGASLSASGGGGDLHHQDARLPMLASPPPNASSSSPTGGTGSGGGGGGGVAPDPLRFGSSQVAPSPRANPSPGAYLEAGAQPVPGLMDMLVMLRGLLQEQQQISHQRDLQLQQQQQVPVQPHIDQHNQHQQPQQVPPGFESVNNRGVIGAGAPIIQAATHPTASANPRGGVEPARQPSGPSSCSSSSTRPPLSVPTSMHPPAATEPFREPVLIPAAAAAASMGPLGSSMQVSTAVGAERGTQHQVQEEGWPLDEEGTRRTSLQRRREDPLHPPVSIPGTQRGAQPSTDTTGGAGRRSVSASRTRSGPLLLMGSSRRDRNGRIILSSRQRQAPLPEVQEEQTSPAGTLPRSRSFSSGSLGGMINLFLGV